jgi:hypothetical protein
MKAILLLTSATMMAMAQTATPGAMVFGTVQSNTGAPIPGAWVTIYRDTLDPNKPVQQFTAGAPSSKDGAFAFSSLDAGVYHFCAALPGSTWLNPCDWDTKRVTTELNANQMARGVVLTMKPGVALPIQIDDPGVVMDTSEKTRAGAHILVGVATASGGFQPADLKSSDKNGRTSEVLIPFDTPVKVVIHSSLFLLTDAGGTAFSNGHSESSISVLSGRTPTPVTVKVTGIKP